MGVIGGTFMSLFRMRIWALVVFFLLPLAVYSCWDTYAPKGFKTVNFNGVKVKYLERVIGADDESAQLPMIIFLHGYGGKAHRYPREFRKMPFPVRMIFPRAFYEDKTSWYESANIAEHLPETGQRIAFLTRALTEKYPTQGKPVLYGFSQGGAVAIYNAVWYPTLYSGILSEGGSLDKSLMPDSLDRGVSYPEVVCLYGTKDILERIERGQRSAGELKALGLSSFFKTARAHHRCFYTGGEKMIYEELEKMCGK